MSENKKIESNEKLATEAQITTIKDIVQEQNYSPVPTEEKLLKMTRKKASDFIQFLIDQKSLASTKQSNKDKGTLFNDSLFHMSRAAARDTMLHFGRDPTLYPSEYEGYIRIYYGMDLSIKGRLKDDIAKGVFK